jgi:hypothetical protein
MQSSEVEFMKVIALEERFNELNLTRVLSTSEVIYSLTANAGYSEVDQNRFFNIAKYESMLGVNMVGYASNDSVQYLGLFQIAYPGTWYGHKCTGNIMNFVDNTNCAIKIQQESGWSQWQVYTNGLVQ